MHRGPRGSFINYALVPVRIAVAVVVKPFR